MKKILVALVLLTVVAVVVGLRVWPSGDASWDPSPYQSDGRLLFHEHHTAGPSPIYTAEENAVMSEQIDEVAMMADPRKRPVLGKLRAFPDTVGVGERAPDFTLPTTDGRELSLSDLRGKLGVFMFVAMTCPPARAQVPRFESLRDKYSRDDVEFFAIYSRERHPGETGFPDFVFPESDEEKLEYARMLGETTTLPIAVDGVDEIVLDAYGGVPNPAYVVDRDGVIVFRSTWADSRKIEQVLETLLAGDVAVG